MKNRPIFSISSLSAVVVALLLALLAGCAPFHGFWHGSCPGGRGGQVAIGH